jgi:hypothetical protein
MPPQNTTIQAISDKDPEADSGKKPSASSAKGPPSQFPKPKAASDSSLYASVGKASQQSGQAGLGAEGGSTSMVGMQGLALVQRGLQMLNLAFPDNPGLMAVLADITGRLQSIIPQLVAQQSNGMGSGLFPQPQAPMPGAGAAPPGAPPAGMPMPPSGPPMQ